MKHTLEVYITNDQVTKEDWDKLYLAIRQYAGSFARFEIIESTKDNIVRYFIRSNHDLSSLGNNLPGMIVTSVNNDEIKLPHTPSKLRFMRFITGGSILDLKEKYSVKKAVELEYSVLNVRSINENKAVVKGYFYFKTTAGTHVRATKMLGFFPGHLLAAELGGSGSKYLKNIPPKYLDIEKSMSLLSSSDQNPIFSVNGFPYFSSDYYINLNNYDFDKHSFIVGASGSGKSMLISLLIDRLAKSPVRNNYRVIVIDPHSSLKNDLKHIENSQIIDFGQEGAELFSGASQDVQASTELTATLFRSLMSDQANPRLDRVLRFSLFVIFTAQAMSLDNLKRFLTDMEYRNQMLEHVKGYTPDNIQKFFGADFNEIRTQFYNEAIVPIVSLVDEMQLQPGMTGSDGVSLSGMIQDHFLSVLSLNKVSMGEKVVKTIAGLILQQIFLLAQGRTFNEKLILIIDEVSIVQNPAMAQILAEARKFNLSIILAQQYFGQVEKDLQDAIFANTMNYYVFKISEEDARAIEGNLSINLPKSLVESSKEAGLKESDVRVKILTELNPRECLVRLAANGQIYPCIKARTVDAAFETAKNTVVSADTPLTPVDSKKSKLPDKFVEHDEPSGSAASDLPPAPISEGTAEEQIAKDMSYEPPVPSQTPPPMETEPVPADNLVPTRSAEPAVASAGSPINLSALLAEHSSSRKTVNSRKVKK